MKVCVFGAGAIGGHLAGRLAAGGADVSVVARGAHLAAMQQDGLRVEAPDATLHSRPHASSDPAELGPQDAVIVSVKTPALPSVAASIAPLLGPETPVLFAINGIPWWYHQGTGHADSPLLDPGGVLKRAVPPERVLGGVVYSACTVVRPGVVEVESGRSRLEIGEPDGSHSPRLEALAAPLREGGLTIEITDRIRTQIWAKLILNLGSGTLGVLTASPSADIFREPACEAATRQIAAEAAAVARALGCEVTPNVEGQIRNGKASMHKTSILQDLELGRPMEIDSLYTAPLQMAREAGVATPMLDLLCALIRVRARAAGLYPR